MRDLDQSTKAKVDSDVDKQARMWTEKLEQEFGITKEHVQKVIHEFRVVWILFTGIFFCSRCLIEF